MGPHWWNRKISPPLNLTSLFANGSPAHRRDDSCSALVNSVICLHLFIDPAWHYCTADLSERTRVSSSYRPSFSIGRKQCQLKKKSVSDPSGYWLVQWSEARGLYYYYYIVCVLFSEKYLVVPLDGAIAFVTLILLDWWRGFIITCWSITGPKGERPDLC